MKSQQFNRVFSSQRPHVPMMHNAMKSVNKRFNVSRKNRDFPVLPPKFIESPDRQTPVYDDDLESSYIQAYNESRISSCPPSKKVIRCDSRKGIRLGPQKQRNVVISLVEINPIGCDQQCDVCPFNMEGYFVKGEPQAPMIDEVQPATPQGAAFEDVVDCLSYDFLKTTLPVSPSTINVAFATGKITTLQALSLAFSSMSTIRWAPSGVSCQHCGYVAICPHIIKIASPENHSDLYTIAALYSTTCKFAYGYINVICSPQQSSTPFEFISALMGRPVRKIDDLTPDCYYQWCALRSLGLFYYDERCKAIVNNFEKILCSEVKTRLPVSAIPQSILSDLISTVTNYMASMFSFIKCSPQFISDIYRGIRDYLVQQAFVNFCSAGSLTIALCSVIKKTVQNFFSDAYALVKEKFDKFVDSGLCLCFVKTSIRVLLEYTPMQIALEIIWDDDFISNVVPYVQEFVSYLIGDWFSDAENATPNAPDSPLLLILAALAISTCGSFGLVSDGGSYSVREMMRLLTNASALVYAGDRLGFGAYLQKLQDYISAEDPTEKEIKRWAILFPNTVKMVEVYREITQLEVVSPSLSADLRFFYGKYIIESAKFNEDRSRITNYCSAVTRYIADQGFTSLGATRLEPCMIMFSGEPGLGKSVLRKILVTDIAMARLNSLNSSDAHIRRVEDLVYNVCPTDKYASGYAGQSIWTHDDWLQANDSESDPSVDIHYAFTLVTSEPMALNMAAVDQKGMKASCDLIVGATNVKFFDQGRFQPDALKPYVKSIADVSALRRRIKFIVIPMVKSPFVYEPKNGRILTPEGRPLTAMDHINPNVLYDFLVFDTANSPVPSPTGSNNWTWIQIKRMAYAQYMASVNFVPDSKHNDTWRDLIEGDFEEAESQAPGDEEFEEPFRTHVRAAIAGNVVGKFSTEIPGPLRLTNSSSPLTPTSKTVVTGVNSKVTVLFVDKDWVVTDCPCGRRDPVNLWGFHNQCTDALNVTPIDDCVAIKNFKSVTRYPNTLYHVNHVGPPSWIIVKRVDADFQHDSVAIIANKNEKQLASFLATMRGNTSKVVYCTEDCKIYGFSFVQGTHYFITTAQDSVTVDHRVSMSSGKLVGAVVVGLLTLGLTSYATKKAAAAVADVVSAAYSKAKQFVVAGRQYFFYNADEGYYEASAQGPNIVVIEGKRYISVVTKKGFTRLYPEDEWVAQSIEDNTFMKAFTKNKRFSDQLPSVVNNLWAVVSESGKLIGSVLAINETSCVTALHVARYMVTRSVSLRRDNIVLSLSAPGTDASMFEVVAIGADQACIHFFIDRFPKFRLPNAKTMLQKFCCSAGPVPLTCDAVFVNRMADGTLSVTECNVSPADYKVGYVHGSETYRLNPTEIRAANFDGFPGACGGVYLHYGETNSEMIIGVHTAFLDSRRLSCLNVFTPASLKLCKMRSPGTSYSSEEGANSIGPCSITKLPSSSHVGPTNVSSLGKKGVTLFVDKSGADYTTAPLRPFSVDGVYVDPVLRNIVDIASSSRAPRKKTSDLLKAMEHLVGVYMAVPNASSILYYGKLPWHDVVSAASGLPHIDLKAACGYPFNSLNPSKIVFFDTESHKLLPEAVEFMDYYDTCFAPPDWQSMDFEDFPEVDSACQGCLKDEPRPMAKAIEGKTRLFTVCPIQEFLMQRRYFLDFAHLLVQRNLSVYSALGCGPEDYGAIHDVAGDKVVATGDFSKFDRSFTKTFIHACGKAIIMWYIKRFGNDEVNGRVVPGYPPLDRDNFIRYRLIDRLANFKCIVGEEIAQFGLMHPSGSFLTTIINIVGQSLLWTDIFLSSIGESFNDHVSMTFLGDDSVVFCDRELAPPCSFIEEKMQSHGFTITGDVKDRGLEWREQWLRRCGTVSDYKFLSRHFARPIYYDGAPVSDDVVFNRSCYGVLTGERLLKMLHFSDLKKMPENFPSQVLNFISEIKLWYNVDDYCPVINDAKEVLAPLGSDFLYRALLMQPSSILMFVSKWLKDNPDYAVAHRDFVPGTPQADSESAETTFAKDDDVVEEDVFDFGDNHCSDNMDAPMHDLSTIFQRPFRVTQFNWLKTSGNGVKLYAGDYPSAYFSGNFNAQAKMSNYAALRGVLCIKVTVSSSPFAQGLLLLSARPLGRSSLSEYEASGDPNVIIDCASGTSAIIKVPTVVPQGWSFVEFFSGNNAVFDWCRISITVLSALLDNGTAGVQVNVFAWLEDVELRNPTLTNWGTSPQGLWEADSMLSGHQGRALMERKGDEAIVNDATSKRMKTIGAYVRTYGGYLVDTVAILAIMSKFAVCAGLSKPSDESGSARVEISAAVGTHFMTGASGSLRMATIAGQKIVIPPGLFGCKEDEMDIKRFVSRPGLMRRISWTAAQSSGTVISEFYATPGNGHAVATNFYHSPLSFVASMFQMWRGMIRYTFLASKTKFAAGQIEIIWQLGTGEAPLTTDSEAANCYRVIWDLQENACLKVDLPFCSMLKWCQVFMADDINPLVPPSYLLNHTNGVIVVRILNPLVTADATVATSVDILVMVAGGEDIEFAVPYRQRGFANGFAVSPGPMSSSEGKEEEEPFVRGRPQGGDIFAEMHSDMNDKPITLTRSSKHTAFGAVTHIGEVVANLRLLLKRMFMVPTGFTSIAVGFNTFQVYYGYDSFMANSPILSYLSHAFAFFTGGVRYSIQGNFNVKDDPSFAVSKTRLVQINLFSTFGYTGASAPYANVDGIDWFLTATNPTAMFDIPYQSVVPFMPIGTLDSASTLDKKPTAQVSANYIINASAIGANTSFAVLVGAADDFTMGWQIGLPACTYTANANVYFSWANYV